MSALSVPLRSRSGRRSSIACMRGRLRARAETPTVTEAMRKLTPILQHDHCVPVHAMRMLELRHGEMVARAAYQHSPES